MSSPVHSPSQVSCRSLSQEVSFASIFARIMIIGRGSHHDPLRSSVGHVDTGFIGLTLRSHHSSLSAGFVLFSGSRLLQGPV